MLKTSVSFAALAKIVLLTPIVLPALAHSAEPSKGPLKVFLLAGQSNMEGQAVVDLDHPEHYNGGKGTLVRVMAESKTPERYGHLKTPDGDWSQRDDVFVRYRTENELKRGPLSIGFAVYPGRHHFGPELQFGHVMGDCFDEPVLLIKTAWGGKSLYKDFRPPSADGETGPYFLQMIAEYKAAIAAVDSDFPALAGRQPELAGFVWFQGWNDMFDDQARAEYADNLVRLVDDVRAELKAPALPVVIGELGNGGPDADKNMLEIRAAQATAAERIKPAGSALFVPTSHVARPAEQSPNTGHGHHWFGNAESYFLIGDALGEAMKKLCAR